jgi:sporulation protein YabP
MVNTEFRADMPHSLSLDERHHLTVTGVSEVLSFDENEVVMDTSLGMLTVEGEQLHVEKLSLDIGELTLEGSVHSLCYSRGNQKKGSVWSRLF